MRWFAIAALIWALAGCINNDAGRTDTVWVVKKTDVTLHFTIILVDGTPFELPDQVPPGAVHGLLRGSQLDSGAGMMEDRCTVGDLIAYDPTGREIARHPPGLCARTNDVWTIGPLSSPEPSG